VSKAMKRQSVGRMQYRQNSSNQRTTSAAILKVVVTTIRSGVNACSRRVGSRGQLRLHEVDRELAPIARVWCIRACVIPGAPLTWVGLGVIRAG
jgi:hypothetical protein